MILTDIVGLAKAGVEAKDLLTLQEKGYTQEIIDKLLSVESPSLVDIKAKSEEEKKRLEDEKKAKDEADAAEKKEKEDLLKQLEEANNKVEDLEGQLKGIQKDNRGKDMGSDLPDPDEYKKNINDFISSHM